VAKCCGNVLVTIQVFEIKIMSKRELYLDSLRGIAVIIMIQQHLLAWLWSEKWISYALTFKEHPAMLSLNFIGNFAAPLFLILAGIGSSLLKDKRNADRSEYFKRGIIILACGYILNILSIHWFTQWSWYILHTIGIAIIISPFLFKMPTVLLLAILLIIMLVPSLIQTFLHTPLMLGDVQMNSINGYGGVLRLIIAEGHFPIFPWVAFYIAGIICSRWGKKRKRIYFLYMALALIITGTILGSLHSYGYFFATGGKFFRIFVITPYLYPLHIPLMLFLLGVSLVIVYFFSYIRSGGFIESIATIGRLSLTWFFVHIIVFNELLRLYGFHKIFSEAGTLRITWATVFFMIFISIIWKKVEYKFSMEWFIRRVIKL